MVNDILELFAKDFLTNKLYYNLLRHFHFQYY